MTVFASGHRACTFDYQTGDVGYVPFAMGHYLENTGDETLTFLELFRSDHFADASLARSMGASAIHADTHPLLAERLFRSARRRATLDNTSELRGAP